jgi:hypothetical protein
VDALHRGRFRLFCMVGETRKVDALLDSKSNSTKRSLDDGIAHVPSRLPMVMDVLLKNEEWKRR